MQHNGHSYHTCITGFGTTEAARRAFRKRKWPDHIEKGNVDHAPRTPNGLPLSCAALIDWEGIWANASAQKRHDLGPRSGVSYSGGLGRRIGTLTLYVCDSYRAFRIVNRYRV